MRSSPDRDDIEDTLTDRERIKRTAHVTYDQGGHYDEYVIAFAYLFERDGLVDVIHKLERRLKQELSDEWTIMGRGTRVELRFTKMGERDFSRNDEDLLAAFARIEQDEFILPDTIY
jgi:hypothetical protein